MNPKSKKGTKKRPHPSKKPTPKRLFTRKEMHLDEALIEKKRNTNLFRKMKKYWPLSKISGRIFLIYFLVVMFGGFLLSIPGVVTNGNYHWNFLVGVFTAASGFSDTGITIANVSADYSFWGQLITILLIETGGIGILTFKIVLYLALNHKISVNDTMVAQTERGSSIPSSTVELIRDGFIWLSIVQILAAFILFFGFFFLKPGTEVENIIIDADGNELGHGQLDTVSPYRDFAKSLWFAIYHSTSAMNNAGFDIISGSSLQPYNVEGHRAYLIQVTFLIEWVVGGLGYPTFHDIKRKIKARRMGQKVRFSLFTKLNFCVYLLLLVVGPLLIFTSEIINKDNSLVFNYYKYRIIENYNVPVPVQIMGPKPWPVVMMDIIFNTTSTRNAGFSTININDFNAGSKVIMSTLMFIGSAPSSTAGGIRTTTLAIIFLATWSIIRNNNQTTAFKKTIPESTVKRAFAAFFISMCLATMAVIVIFIDSANVLARTADRVGNISIIQIITLITSAFGTVGLNPFTGEQMLAFGALSKLVLILTMFIGQLGVSNTLLIFVKPSQRKAYEYLKEDVVIG